MLGFCAALFGCLATSTKTILAESLLHGYKFDRYRLFAYLILFGCNVSFITKFHPEFLVVTFFFLG